MKYATGVISIFAVIGYFSPWLFGATREMLSFYIPAFLWFLFAWIAILYQMYAAIKKRKSGVKEWKAHGISVALGLTSYLAVGIGVMNGYMVTV